MKPIIEVKGLSKKYRLGEIQPYYTLRDSLAGLFSNPLAAVKGGLSKGEFWALKDINFEVNQGEVVGIIGRNGAGKSTLLKILSQITPPTEGEVILRGRVGSLLEVGTGFSPELTGRENIYLNGAIMGMKRTEVKRRFDEIVAFSEVENFLDTPLKRYSSGMYMRLAFAVAAHLEPEILIVDEVLAVGDAEFQKKCLGKMGEVASEGRTVLFVSHNIGAIQTLCSRALVLEGGQSLGYGDIATKLKQYLQSTKSKNNAHQVIGSVLQVSKFTVVPSAVESGKRLEIDLNIKVINNCVINDLAVIISNASVRISLLDFRQNTPYILHSGQELAIKCKVNNLALVEGSYDLTLYVRYNHDKEDHLHNIQSLDVITSIGHSLVVPYSPSVRGIMELQNSFSYTIRGSNEN